MTWIKCSERMPEETEIIGGDDFSPDVLTINQHGEQWVCSTQWGSWIHTKHKDCVITHWMPLPKEPEEWCKQESWSGYTYFIDRSLTEAINGKEAQ